MADPAISVIIPARDAQATLPATLDGLAAQRVDGGAEVIVVDDASTDATAAIASRSSVVDRVLRADGGGPAQARNAGAAAAAAPLLAFLDADCRPAAGWLAAGSAALAACDLVIGQTLPRPDQPLGPFDRSLSVTRCSPLFESANLFVGRDLFDALGGFESWLGPRAGKELGEDVWFGWRAVRSGARTAYCPEALAHHEVFPRGPLGFATERWRLRFFPSMARRMPELRDAFFYRRYFLNARQARFDAALAGLLLARLARRPALATAALPYARTISRDLREPGGAGRAAARTLADAIGLGALVVGSVRARSLLL
jgi:glycosyltransferase involved in cell wall biosynthesis